MCLIFTSLVPRIHIHKKVTIQFRDNSNRQKNTHKKLIWKASMKSFHTTYLHVWRALSFVYLHISTKHTPTNAFSFVEYMSERSFLFNISSLSTVRIFFYPHFVAEKKIQHDMPNPFSGHICITTNFCCSLVCHTEAPLNRTHQFGKWSQVFLVELPQIRARVFTDFFSRFATKIQWITPRSTFNWK